MEKELKKIPIDSTFLEGSLIIPKGAESIIIFVYGSGSSRHSPRNTYVAKSLQNSGFATFLLDLLTEEEDQDYMKRFDIPFLKERLKTVMKYLMGQKGAKDLNIGYFGASTGAAVALEAAVELPNIKAIVSRGGRPDLAGEYLFRVKSPTLLIVGGDDTEVLELNRAALKKLSSIKNLEIVPGATHLFEEEGALDEVVRLTSDWFKKYL